jgi:hypothetical protein
MILLTKLLFLTFMEQQQVGSDPTSEKKIWNEIVKFKPKIPTQTVEH